MHRGVAGPTFVHMPLFSETASSCSESFLFQSVTEIRVSCKAPSLRLPVRFLHAAGGACRACEASTAPWCLSEAKVARSDPITVQGQAEVREVNMGKHRLQNSCVSPDDRGHHHQAERLFWRSYPRAASLKAFLPFISLILASSLQLQQELETPLPCLHCSETFNQY